MASFIYGKALGMSYLFWGQVEDDMKDREDLTENKITRYPSKRE